ncbi:cullin-1 [Anaeramoeba flamelloides]|uniref:Cullin-1 n=1 Tax=Anaeramoeba flamelloides TaxID=1746091 RepID=A0ABQ8XR66_9EUKA|nr:cullin-1 [Anaeramoeba flamelloides]
MKDFLSQTISCWTQYYTSAKVISLLFSFLDRNFLPRIKNNNKNEIKEYLDILNLNLNIFNLGYYQPLKDQIIHQTLELINKRRRKQPANFGYFKKIIEMILTLDAKLAPNKKNKNNYKQDFEAPLIFNTDIYYERAYYILRKERNFDTFTKNLIAIVEDELHFIGSNLRNTTQKKLEKSLVKKIFIPGLKIIMEKIHNYNSVSMNDQNTVNSLLDLVNNFPRFRDFFCRYIFEIDFKKIKETWTNTNKEREFSIIHKLIPRCKNIPYLKVNNIKSEINNSEQINSSFQNNAQLKKKKLPIQFHITICGESMFPFKCYDIEFMLPRQLLFCKQQFEDFYQNYLIKLKSPTRKLNWNFPLSTIELIFYSKAQRYILYTSIYEAKLLLMFNSKRIIKFEKIQQVLKLPQELIIKLLQFLISNKILKAKTNIHQIGNRYKVNSNSRQVTKKIKLKLNLTKNKELESKILIDQIGKLKQIKINKTIIRIMKKKKKIQHKELIKLVRWQLLPVDSYIKDRTIKKSISYLIDLNYLERKENSTEIYKYIS